MSLKVLKDYTGHRIGKVVFIKRHHAPRVVIVGTGDERRAPPAWLARCDCGTEWVVPTARISTHSPASCNACADRSKKRTLPKSSVHKKTGHPSYGSWYAMIRRCTDEKHENYHRYGGRGITVDSSWFDFDRFVADMGNRPPNKTLDRIDNNGHYTKENCRWATAKEQRANSRPPTRRKL